MHPNKALLKAKTIPSTLTYEIRKNILWPHIKNNDDSLDIDNKPETFHLGVFLQEKIISVGTFVKENNPEFETKKQYRLRAMGTSSIYQKNGAGRILIQKAMNLLKENNMKLLWCSSRIHAIPFYQNLNMKSLKDIYNIKYIGPHKTMYIYLKSEK